MPAQTSQGLPTVFRSYAEPHSLQQDPQLQASPTKRIYVRRRSLPPKPSSRAVADPNAEPINGQPRQPDKVPLSSRQVALDIASSYTVPTWEFGGAPDRMHDRSPLRFPDVPSYPAERMAQYIDQPRRYIRPYAPSQKLASAINELNLDWYRLEGLRDMIHQCTEASITRPLAVQTKPITVDSSPLYPVGQLDYRSRRSRSLGSSTTNHHSMTSRHTTPTRRDWPLQHSAFPENEPEPSQRHIALGTWRLGGSHQTYRTPRSFSSVPPSIGSAPNTPRSSTLPPLTLSNTSDAPPHQVPLSRRGRSANRAFPAPHRTEPRNTENDSWRPHTDPYLQYFKERPSTVFYHTSPPDNGTRTRTRAHSAPLSRSPTRPHPFQVPPLQLPQTSLDSDMMSDAHVYTPRTIGGHSASTDAKRVYRSPVSSPRSASKKPQPRPSQFVRSVHRSHSAPIGTSRSSRGAPPVTKKPLEQRLPSPARTPRMRSPRLTVRALRSISAPVPYATRRSQCQTVATQTEKIPLPPKKTPPKRRNAFPRPPPSTAGVSDMASTSRGRSTSHALHERAKPAPRERFALNRMPTKPPTPNVHVPSYEQEATRDKDADSTEHDSPSGHSALERGRVLAVRNTPAQPKAPRVFPKISGPVDRSSPQSSGRRSSPPRSKVQPSHAPQASESQPQKASPEPQPISRRESQMSASPEAPEPQNASSPASRSSRASTPAASHHRPAGQPEGTVSPEPTNNSNLLSPQGHRAHPYSEDISMKEDGTEWGSNNGGGDHHEEHNGDATDDDAED